MIVAHLDTGRDWRGGQVQVALLMRGLAARGVTSALAAPRAPLLERARSANHATLDWNPRGDLDALALGRVRAWLAELRPDVVHVHGARAHALGVPAARLAGVRAVIASRRVVIPPRRDPLSRLKYAMPVDRWLCVSDAVRRALIGAGVPEAITRVVPSGVDLEALREAAATAARGEGADVRQELDITSDAPLLTTVASLTAEKNHAMLLRVAARVRAAVPAAHHVWCGGGALRSALERERDAMGLTNVVHVLGARDDVAGIVAASTMLLVASRHEGFCGAAVEAQALGVPVIATRVGGLPEVVLDGETGVLVPDDDDAAMAASIAALLNDPARRAALGARARVHAENFACERMVERTLGVYQEVVGHSVAG